MKYFLIILLGVVLSLNTAHAENSQLKDAIVKGDLVAAKKQITRANMNDALDSNGLTPLHLAALYGHKKIAKKLLGLGARVNATDAVGTTPLFQAAGNGHVNVLVLLKKYGANLNAKDATGKTALHYTALGNKLEAAKYLVSIGANKNIKDNDGKTPLDYARGKSNSQLVQLFGASQQQIVKRPPPAKPVFPVNGQSMSRNKAMAQQQLFMQQLAKMRDAQKQRDSITKEQLSERLVGLWVDSYSNEDIEFKADGILTVTRALLPDSRVIVDAYFWVVDTYFWEALEGNQIRVTKKNKNFSKKYHAPVDMYITLKGDHLTLPPGKLTGHNAFARATKKQVDEVRVKRQIAAHKRFGSQREIPERLHQN